MEFKGQYLTFEEYEELGGTLKEVLLKSINQFNILEFKARKLIDQRTQNIFIGKEIPQEVKLCMFELINIIKSHDSKEITSENIDGYSVSYASSETTFSQDIDNTIMTYLINTVIDGHSVLYLGRC